MQYSVVYFDGVCNLCNGFVIFLIKHDKRELLKFAQLQSSYPLNLSIEYRDSAQTRVNLSFSSLPEGVSIAEGWVNSGYPTFQTAIVFKITDSLFPPKSGRYPMSLNATTVGNQARKYDFNFDVIASDSCVGRFCGQYNCLNTATRINFADSIYQDANIPTKIWFSNFCNTNKKVAGVFSCESSIIYIPVQVIDGDTLSGTGYCYGVAAPYKINLQAYINRKSSLVKM